MNNAARVIDWLVGDARFLGTNPEFFERFCEKLAASGIPLARSWLHIRALHPEFAGVSRLWKRGAAGIEERYLEYGYETQPVYLRSTVRQVVERREPQRWGLEGAIPPEFPLLGELRGQGYTDYFIAPIVYSGGMLNVISWATDRRGGFADSDIEFFRRILPHLSVVLEAKSLRRFAKLMLTTYAGQEPGELILKGQIRRGDVRTITAALMLADLRDFTALSDSLAPDQVIKMLNRYFDCVIPPVRQRGGEIMEIMGDGVLAIFNQNGKRGPEEACQAAFDAATEALAALAEANRTRGEGAPELRSWFSLHHGQVSYGNIGSGNRLDFTVIGPDVNLTSRLERLCRELDRDLVMSGAFVARLGRPMFEIGHFQLRGFSKMQLVFGLPAEDAPEI